MPLTETIVLKVGARFASHLFQRYLGEKSEGVVGDLVDIGKERISDFLGRRDAAREFERLGERMAANLLPIFEESGSTVNAEAVAFELERALEGHLAADFFVARDLNPAQITAHINELHPLAVGQLSEAEEGLYYRALNEAVRYLIEVAVRLPRFDSAAVTESLTRLSSIIDLASEVAERVKRIETIVTSFHHPSSETKRSDSEKEVDQAARFETDYRLAVIQNLDELDLFGVDLPPESRRQKLSVAFVSLNLTSRAGTADLETSNLTSFGSALQQLKDGSSRLLIRGEAGSGKSTLFRWATIQAANFGPTNINTDIGMNYARKLREHWLSTVTATWKVLRKLTLDHSAAPLQDFDHDLNLQVRPIGGPYHGFWSFRVPFLIRLRDCQDGRLPRPDDFPDLIARELGRPPSDWVRMILDQGRALLLLDGIDEVPPSNRDRLRGEIGAILRAFPESYALASTRPEAIPEDWLSDLDFCEARINPMSESDRNLFIDNWHTAVGEQLRQMGRGSQIGTLPRLADQLKEQLLEQPSVAALALNPLLCAMIAALHRETQGKLPESQGEICEALCHMLLHRRERESGLDLSAFPEAYRRLTYKDKRTLVQDIAHDMVLNSESSISFGRAEEKIVERLRWFQGFQAADAGVILQSLVERSGILREVRPQQLDFAHNTFKEFLAGQRFGDEGDAGFLAEHAGNSEWDRISQFSATTRRDGFTSDLVRRILKSNVDGIDPNIRARQLLALRCRTAAGQVQPELGEQLDVLQDSLFPPRSFADAETLATTGDAAVTYLRSHPDHSATEAASCIRALRLIGTPLARKTLDSYLSDDRSEVLNELAQAVDPLRIGAIVTSLQGTDRVSLPSEGILSQITTLNALQEKTDIVNLMLCRTRVSDLTPLTHFRSLQALDLLGTPVTDLSPIANIHSLRKLYLDETETTDLFPIVGLRDLQELSLARSPLVDISPVARLTELRSMNLSDTGIVNLVPIAQLPQLKELDLSRCRIPDLGPVSELQELQMLSLSGMEISELKILAKFKHLEWLNLSGTEITDLKPLAHLERLKVLFLLDTPVIDLSHLLKLPALERLHLEGSDQADLSSLDGHPSIVVFP